MCNNKGYNVMLMILCNATIYNKTNTRSIHMLPDKQLMIQIRLKNQDWLNTQLKIQSMTSAVTH